VQLYRENLELMKPSFEYSNPFDDYPIQKIITDSKKEKEEQGNIVLKNLSTFLLITKNIENLIPPKILNTILSRIYNCPDKKNYKSIFDQSNNFPNFSKIQHQGVQCDIPIKNDHL